MVPSKLPGMSYTADEQCQILFGPLASFCQEMQVRLCPGGICEVHVPVHCLEVLIRGEEEDFILKFVAQNHPNLGRIF